MNSNVKLSNQFKVIGLIKALKEGDVEAKENQQDEHANDTILIKVVILVNTEKNIFSTSHEDNLQTNIHKLIYFFNISIHTYTHGCLSKKHLEIYVCTYVSMYVCMYTQKKLL